MVSITESLAPQLGSILVDSGILDEAQAVHWTAAAVAEGVPLETLLVREKVVDRSQLLHVIENFFFCPAVDVAAVPFDADRVQLLPAPVARRHQALAVGVRGDTVVVAFSQPDDEEAVNQVAQALQRPVRAVVALPGDLREKIDADYARAAASTGARPETVSGAGTPDEPPPHSEPPDVRGSGIESRLAALESNTASIVDGILASAAAAGATYVHVEPTQQSLRVRFRIDGLLQTAASLPVDLTPAVSAHLKAMVPANMRVSSLPSQFGDTITVRLPAPDAAFRDLDGIGMPPEVRVLQRDMIESPAGLFLVTGPRGSGKTTTLYAALAALERESQSIVTVENPVERPLNGITPVQIDTAADTALAHCLQSMLLQDHDVVMTDEIRSAGVAEIACRLAYSGHKVFSTLYTADATGAVARLLDMGCAPHWITAALRGVLAQRLVRVICKSCKETCAPSPRDAALLGTAVRQLHRGRGCSECSHTGYRGRMAIFEYFRMDDRYRPLVLAGAPAAAIRSAARRHGMTGMTEYAKRAVRAGLTTVAEIERGVLVEDGYEDVPQCGGEA